ncbi:hypothetical protein Tco_1122231 [Tanacetum coccineum]|uniref:Uncharacterized protein n=1 Tax=Tanacetum coccineum TaxID=301880 RepID=A0ABQ5IZY3_9ASTR
MKNKPKLEAQARKNMVVYLKNQGNYKIKDFDGMSYDEIRPIFKKIWDFNQKFKPMDSEHVIVRMSKEKGQKKSDEKIDKEGVDTVKEKKEEQPEQVVKEVSKKPEGKRRKILAKKRTRDAQDKEISKRQKLDKEEEEDDQEEENITQYVEIVPFEEIAISAIPLDTKPPVIVDVEIVNEGQLSSYYIIRADGKSTRYNIMTLMFQDIDREDLENLWKIIKEKFKDADTKEAYKRVMWGDFKIMFEPDLESKVWKMIENYDVTAWILYSSCGVHLIKFEGLHIFLLVDKVYPLSHSTITKMLDRKLQVDHQNEIVTYENFWIFKITILPL